MSYVTYGTCSHDCYFCSDLMFSLNSKLEQASNLDARTMEDSNERAKASSEVDAPTVQIKVRSTKCAKWTYQMIYASPRQQAYLHAQTRTSSPGLSINIAISTITGCVAQHFHHG